VIMGVRTRETIPYKRKKSSMNIPAVSDIKGNNMTKTLFLTRLTSTAHGEGSFPKFVLFVPAEKGILASIDFYM